MNRIIVGAHYGLKDWLALLGFEVSGGVVSTQVRVSHSETVGRVVADELAQTRPQTGLKLLVRE